MDDEPHTCAMSLLLHVNIGGKVINSCGRSLLRFPLVSPCSLGLDGLSSRLWPLHIDVASHLNAIQPRLGSQKLDVPRGRNLAPNAICRASVSMSMPRLPNDNRVWENAIALVPCDCLFCDQSASLLRQTFGRMSVSSASLANCEGPYGWQLG